MVKPNVGETIDGVDIERIRDAYNRGYEKGYKKGQEDEIQRVRQAQADRDFYDRKRKC